MRMPLWIGSINHLFQNSRTYQYPLPGAELDLNGSCIVQTPAVTASDGSPTSPQSLNFRIAAKSSPGLTRPRTSTQPQRVFPTRRRPAGRSADQGLTPLDVTKNLRNQRRILDTGHDPQLTPAIGTGFDIDGEYSFEALHPAHGCHGFIAVHRATRPARHDPAAVDGTTPNL